MESIPDSILFVETEFDLAYLEQLVTEETRRLNHRDPADAPIINTVEEYSVRLFQLRDPHDPPLCDFFQGPMFYIRKCYKIYYDLITACIDSGKYHFLTIVGSPGTGKSLMYLYVVRRYRHDHPDVTVVVASFDNDRTMMKCFVYEPGGGPVVHASIPEIEGAVYFYDGPPSRLPTDNKMVCFTFPHHQWVSRNFKEPRHHCLWFPPWTLEELYDANNVCGLGLTEEIIKSRFNFFGGSARYCLSKDESIVRKGRIILTSKIWAVDSFDELFVCLKGEKGTDWLSHQIFHLFPIVLDLFPFVFDSTDTVACSKEVDALICDCIVANKIANYRKLINLIRFIPQASSVRERMFERFANEVLGKGGSFNVSSLGINSTTLTVDIPTGVYRHMEAGCESVDGVALIDDTVVLFQATVAKRHPVNAHGISERLKSVHKFDDFVKGNVRVLLVFVVPSQTRRFSKQQIKLEKLLDDDSSIESIKRMRHSWCQELEAYGITRVGQLREWLERQNNDYKDKYAQYLADFDTRNYSAQYNDTISGIPQYCLTLTGFGENEHREITGEEFLSLQEANRQLTETVASLQRQLDAQVGA